MSAPKLPNQFMNDLPDV